jgi:hypothetical protein
MGGGRRSGNDLVALEGTAGERHGRSADRRSRDEDRHEHQKQRRAATYASVNVLGLRVAGHPLSLDSH